MQAAARSLSESLHGALFLALPSGVATFDAIAFFDAVLNDPTAFGLPPGLNVTDACLGSGLPEPVGPPACAGYAFFDTIHPTAQIHEILGEAFIVAVPEPTTGALVALGLVALGLRRR